MVQDFEADNRLRGSHHRAPEIRAPDTSKGFVVLRAQLPGLVALSKIYLLLVKVLQLGLRGAGARASALVVVLTRWWEG